MKYYSIVGMYYTTDGMPKLELMWDMVKEKWVDWEDVDPPSIKTTSRYFAGKQLGKAKYAAETGGYINDVRLFTDETQ